MHVCLSLFGAISGLPWNLKGQYDCQGRKRGQHHLAFVENAAEGRQRTHIQPQEQIELAQGALILRPVKAGKKRRACCRKVLGKAAASVSIVLDWRLDG